MRKRRRQGILFVLSAPSGAGKTTLCKRLLKNSDNLTLSVSYTTRRPRPGERDGADYHFVSPGRFRQMIARGDFVEWAEVHGNLYGTSRKKLEKMVSAGVDVVLDIDTQGAKKIRQSYRDGVSVFILPPSLSELKKRLRKRASDTEEEIDARLRRASEEMRDAALYDYVIVNDDVRKAFRQLGSVVTAERLRTRLVDAQSIGEIFSGGR